MPVSESIPATIHSGNLAGNATENDTVVESITLNSVGVGTLIGNSTFTLVRQRPSPLKDFVARRPTG